MTIVSFNFSLFILEDCGTNEEYLNPGSACQTTCAQLGKPCALQTFAIPQGCYCIKGYARDDNDKCIPIAKCPPRRHIGV